MTIQLINYKTKKDLKNNIGKELNYKETNIFKNEYKENGTVIGVDMTDEQLAVANNNIEYHREKFGYKNANVEFIKGNITSPRVNE